MASLPFLPGSFSFGQDAPKARVAIVGCGVAGISCARTLRALGVEPVIFEARSRLGGRLYTDRGFGFPVEHGPTAVPATGQYSDIANVAKSLEIKLQPSQYDWWIRGDDGEPLKSEKIAASLAKLEKDFQITAASGAKIGSSASIREALMASRINAFYETSDSMMAILETEGVSGAGIDDLAFWWKPSTAKTPLVTATEGWDKWVEKAALGLDVRLQEAVRLITPTEKAVQIDLDDSTQEFDYVVVTVPLPVLKSRDFTIEGLKSDAWLESAERVGMTKLEKVFVEFESRWWEKNKRLADATRPPLPCLYFEPLPDPDRTLLVGYATTPIDPRTITQEVIAQLKNMLGASIPDPVRVTTTKWLNDPYSLGASAFPGIGCKFADIRKLMEPHAGRVFFAGDSTSIEATGTIHGAYLSGIRAAGEVLRKV